jgi:uncharacterized protein (DUF2252 family)
MRSAVDQILAFNNAFPRARLAPKLAKLASSPFGFFRATFHLFAFDIENGPFRRWKCSDGRGRIVGDLHTENFGAFRAVNRQIVYDVNDFDETTEAFYEYDLRRLASSMVLSSLDTKKRLGDGINAAEDCLASYVDRLGAWAKLRSRGAFEHLDLTAAAKAVLHKAAERSRPDFLRTLAVERAPGVFEFAGDPDYQPLKKARRDAVTRALPGYLETCLAPENANPKRYVLLDVANRRAGAGSQGRTRYALLLAKGQGPESWKSLRLIEWKDALDSALDSSAPQAGKRRAAEVFETTRTLQIFPKRYLGVARVDGRPMQAREIGANDARLPPGKLDSEAARLLGAITARVHLLGSLKGAGPRLLTGDPGLVRRVLGFAAAYVDRVMEDFDELERRKEEVARRWSA